MTVLVTVLAITGALTWAVIILGIVGRLIFGPATRTVDQALADVAAAEAKPGGVVVIQAARPHGSAEPSAPSSSTVRLHAVHDRDTCDACAGRDRGSF